MSSFNLFRLKGQELEELIEKPFKLERQTQALVEKHLTLLTGLLFVSSEFSVSHYRIDTLAFDVESQSFVIIEYKRQKNTSVIDQGISYLNTLFKHQADFLLEYQEKTGELLTKKQVDWSQSKVVFVAPYFTDIQKQAVDFKDLNIELWEVNHFADDILSLSSSRPSTNAPSIKANTVASASNPALKETITYTEEHHFAEKPDEMIELYESFKEAICNLIPDVTVEFKKLYIAFKKNRHNVVDIELQKQGLKLFLNARLGTLDDPRQLARDVSNIGHYGNGDYEIKVRDTQYLEYIMSLIKQLV